MKLTKTERALLEEAARGYHGRTTVISGLLRRASGFRGKCYPVGARRASAAQSLADKDLVTLSARSHQSRGEWWIDFTLTITKQGLEVLEPRC